MLFLPFLVLFNFVRFHILAPWKRILFFQQQKYRTFTKTQLWIIKRLSSGGRQDCVAYRVKILLLLCKLSNTTTPNVSGNSEYAVNCSFSQHLLTFWVSRFYNWESKALQIFRSFHSQIGSLKNTRWFFSIFESIFGSIIREEMSTMQRKITITNPLDKIISTSLSTIEWDFRIGRVLVLGNSENWKCRYTSCVDKFITVINSLKLKHVLTQLWISKLSILKQYSNPHIE